MIVNFHKYATARYKLDKLNENEDLVAEAIKIKVPFNNPTAGVSIPISISIHYMPLE